MSSVLFYFITLLNISELFSRFFIFTVLSYVIFQCNNDSDNCKGQFELRNTKKSENVEAVLLQHP